MIYEEARNRIRQEAIDICEHECGIKRGESVICDFCKDMEAFDIAIEALEKQIPKKPINWLGKMPICPRCNRADYIKPLESYCKFCGQAIDWSNEE